MYNKNVLFHIILITLFSQLLLTPLLSAQQPKIVIEKYTVKDGLSNNSVLGIARDKNGFMWFSTYTGISSFDGYNFKSYQIENAHQNPNIYYFQDIVVDHDGSVWASTMLGPIFKLNPSTNKFEPFLISNYSDQGCYFMFVDSRNNIWFSEAPGLMLLKNSDDPRLKILKVNLNDSILDAITIYSIVEDKRGNIWFGALEGLFMVEIKSDIIGKFHKYRIDPSNTIDDFKNEINALYFDDENYLWIGTREQGLLKLDVSQASTFPAISIFPKKIFKHNPADPSTISDNRIYHFIPDHKGNLILRTPTGIEIFNMKTGISRKLCSEGAGSINDDNNGYSICAMYYSPDDILWIGTNEGLLKIRLQPEQFKAIESQVGITKSTSFKTSQVMVDSKERLWIGTPDDGLYVGIKNQSSNYTYGQYVKESNNTRSLWSNSVHCFTETQAGDIWIGAGYFQKAVGEKLDLSFDYNFKDPLPKVGYSFRICTNQILEMNEKLWVMYTNVGIRVFDLYKRDKKIFILGKDKPSIANPYIQISGDQRIFLRDNNGIYELTAPFVDLDKIVIPTQVDTLLTNTIIFPKGDFLLTKTDIGYNFWVPSINNGIYKYFLPNNTLNGNHTRNILKLVNHYTDTNGLSNNSVYDVIEDKNGDIWITTQNGLNRIDKKSGLVRVFDKNDGLKESKFSYGACKDLKGFLYFCTVDGVVTFHPDSLPEIEEPQNVFITDIMLFNRKINDIENFKLNSPVHETKELILNHKQNFLSFNFAAIDYKNNQKIRYRYKMEGLNQEWIEAGNRRFVEYQDLKPGKYKLRINATKSDGSWSTKEAKLFIEIRYPFWQKTWFVVMVILLSVSLVVWFIKVREHNLRLKNIALEKEVKMRTWQALTHQEELEQMKSRFYVNISHEFRTPLTIINALAEALVKNDNSTQKQSFINSIRKASNQLLKLVNELLDLAKIESGNLHLQVAEGDIIQSLRQIWEIYLSEAERKQIKYEFRSESESIIAWYDKAYIEKIMNNLISNALKFTDKGGSISFTVSRLDPNKLLIKVIDTGKGIPEDKLNRVFDRFYQVETSDSRAGEGTGIGLAIVKELIENHHGSIELKSKLDKGSEFNVILPVTKEPYQPDEISEEQDSKKSIFTSQIKDYADLTDQPKIAATKNIRIEPEKPTILVVEDNNDLRDYIIDFLNSDYRVFEAENGITALEIIKEHLPNLIISDIMMPVMDGIKLCQSVKRSTTTCHIPIILLTAKADHNSKVEGLETGADDYLIKPFSTDELKIRCKNLIQQRKLLQQKFSGTPILAPSEFTTNMLDEQLLKKALELVTLNITKTDYSVADFVNDLGLSERNAQRKIKSLTGLTPNEFIRTVRIKYAAKLISESKENISQIAYMVGFNNLSYFSRTFREIIGVSPSEYQNN